MVKFQVTRERMVLSRGSFGVLYYMVSHFVATYFTCCTRILNHQNVCLTRNYCSSCVTAQFHVVHQDDEITFNNFCATLMTYNECDDESDMLTRKRLKCIPHYSKFSFTFYTSVYIVFGLHLTWQEDHREHLDDVFDHVSADSICSTLFIIPPSTPLTEVFELFDLDSSGGITVEEFEVMMQRLNAGLQREDIKGLLQWIVSFGSTLYPPHSPPSNRWFSAYTIEDTLGLNSFAHSHAFRLPLSPPPTHTHFYRKTITSGN